MNHFRSKLTSPLASVVMGCIYVIIMGIILYFLEVYDNSSYFNWGPPLKIMNKTIEQNETFYVLLVLTFFHQLINNWVNEVTYPWIINCVQDPKNHDLQYTNNISLLIVNMFSIYSEVDVLIIILGVMSQISFFIVIIMANIISVTIINRYYIKNKHLIPLLSIDINN